MLLAALLGSLHLPGLFDALRGADPVDLSVVVLVTFGTYGVRAWRYGFLLAPLARVPFRRLVAATYIGFLAGLLVPRIGEVLRPWLVGRRHAIPTSAAFAGIVLERVVDVATILALFGIGLVAGGTERPLSALWRGRLETASLGAGLLASGTLAALLIIQRWPQPALRALATLLRPLPPRPTRMLTGAFTAFSSGLAVLGTSTAHLAAIAGQSLLVWLFIAGGVHAANRAMGIDLPFHAALVVLGFILVGVTLPTPGAVGGFHAAYVVALTALYGVERERATAAAIACHGLTALAVFVVGLLLLPGEGLTFRQMLKGPEPSERPSP